MLAPNLIRSSSGQFSFRILAALCMAFFLLFVFVQTQPMEHHFTHFVSQTQTQAPAEPAVPAEPSEPSESAEPAIPAESAVPVVPAELAEPAEPVVSLPSFTPRFFPYGTSHCLPPPSPELIEEAAKKDASCAAYAPSYGTAPPKHRVGTITAQYGPLKQHYQRALGTHLMHSLVQDTQIHVLCDSLVDDLWNKHAFILDVLMREMLKPADERLEWLMWVDRDTLILDPCRPSWSFLPPLETNKNLIVTNDWNGLNNGVFLVRVNTWAIDLFTTTLAFRYYRPETALRFTEQSAMEIVIKEPRFGREVQWVPQQWFNAYDRVGGPHIYASQALFAEIDITNARRGDFLVHFAGIGNKSEAINNWMDTLAGMDDVWETGSAQRNLTQEVAEFWQSLGLRW